MKRGNKKQNERTHPEFQLSTEAKLLTTLSLHRAHFLHHDYRIGLLSVPQNQYTAFHHWAFEHAVLLTYTAAFGPRDSKSFLRYQLSGLLPR